MEPCSKSILFMLAKSGKEEGTPFIPRMNDGGFQAILGVNMDSLNANIRLQVKRAPWG